MSIWKILKIWLEREASDIIISPNSKPSLKIDWEINIIEEMNILNREELNKDILSIMSEKQRKEFIYKKELDFSIDMKWYSRFRVNAFVQRNGFWLVFRPIKTEIPDFESLGLPPQILNFTNKKHWLILVTWSVWSWKSTTLASLLKHINKTKKKHIITVEDPIEFIYKNELSLIEQREVWEHTDTFWNWLKYALRQASDVIMVWEMRDLETFKLALRAAETGNLVLATLHTSWAARTVWRIIDMFPWGEKEQIKQQLSESLIWVVWQDLIKKSNWTGRTPACEVLVNNTSISNMIRKWLTHQINWAIETGASDWMFPMKKSLDKLLELNIISEESYKESLEYLQ